MKLSFWVVACYAVWIDSLSENTERFRHNLMERLLAWIILAKYLEMILGFEEQKNKYEKN